MSETKLKLKQGQTNYSWMLEDEKDTQNKDVIALNTSIALTILDLMDKHDLTKTEIAKKAGISVQLLGRICHGRVKSISTHTIAKLQSAFGEKIITVKDYSQKL